jgi:hypothetical protein
MSPTSIRSPNGRVATTRRGAGSRSDTSARRYSTFRRKASCNGAAIFPRGRDAGRALVEQPLEQVMLGSVDDSHLGRRTP